MTLARGTLHWVALPAALLAAALLAAFYFEPFRLPGTVLSALLLWLTLQLMVFFRDPERPVAKGIAAPADGKIISVEKRGGVVKIAIFMNIHNVHVNRAPLDGVVRSVKHYAGGHGPAYGPEALMNERVETRLDTVLGEVVVVQIAGLVARRIVPYISKGQRLKKGERIGIILLGSRVDLHLPAARVRVIVKAGDRLRAGCDTVAEVRQRSGAP